MTTVSHCLTGYDRVTEAQIYSAEIPADRFAAIRRFVRFNPTDPDAVFTYELNHAQAMEIISMLANGGPPSRDLAFYLESYAGNS